MKTEAEIRTALNVFLKNKSEVFRRDGISPRFALLDGYVSALRFVLGEDDGLSQALLNEANRQNQKVEDHARRN